MVRLFLILFTLILFNGCVLVKQASKYTPADTAVSVKIDDSWVTAKPSFELNNIGEGEHDTLYLVTCSDYVYFPFGIIKDEIDLKNSILKDLEINSTTDTLADEIVKLQIISVNSSKMVLFFDDNTEGVISSYIIKGEVIDKNVRFINNVKIGISKRDFINEFFELFPDKLIEKYNVFIFESCVSGINHEYTFYNDKLSSVRFYCIDCSWNID